MARNSIASSSLPLKEADAAAIENEIPAYRAISPLALTSLALGIGSLLCYVDAWFSLAAAAAVVTGLMADRKIAKLSDVLTGRTYAKVGIALGLIFGLSAFTTKQVESYFLAREIKSFTNLYLDTIRTGTLEEAVWYRMPPGSRKAISPKQALERLKNAGNDISPYETQTGPIRQIKERLARGGHVEYDQIEAQGVERLNPYGYIRVKLEGGEDPKAAPSGDYALMKIQAEKKGREYQWYVDELTTNYKPKSYVPKPAPVDDGHGHGGGNGSHSH